MPPLTARRRLSALLVTATVGALVLGLTVGAGPAHASTRTVTNCADSGAGSLRQALADAVDGDVINFTGLGCTTITLTSGQLDVADSLTIAGPGRAALTVNGNSAGRVFVILTGKEAVISGLTISNGVVTNAGGGAIFAMGPLTIADCTLTSSASIGGAGQSGSGGAVVATAGLVVTGSTFTNNLAEGGPNESGSGGAILAQTAGTVSISNSVFSNNIARGTGTGIAIAGAISTNRPTTITNTSFTSNTAVGGATAISAQGGAIMHWADLTISGTTTFTSNDVLTSGGSSYGGAIITASGVLTLGGTTTFVGDQAAVNDRPAGGSNTGGDALGGGLYVAAGASLVVSGTTTWQEEVASGGRAVAASNGDGGPARGGAIYLDNTATAAITGTALFDRNTATGGRGGTAPGRAGSARGGAIYALGSLSIGTGATFVENVAAASSGARPAPDIAGGAIAFGSGGSVTGVTFQGNSAQDVSCVGVCPNGALGGAIYNFGAAGPSVTIANSTFRDNYAAAGTPSSDTEGGRGGSIFLTSYSRTTIANSTITGGMASYGAGVFIQDSPNAFSILNTTIAGNTAGVASGGSGLYYRTGNVVGTIANTILADNGGLGTDCIMSASNKLDANTSNLIENGNTACTTGATSLVTADPILSALANNGGTTATMALGAASPALLVADSPTCQSAPVSALDQRGVARPVGLCDIGSYQRSAAPSNDQNSGGESTTSSSGGTTTSVSTPAGAGAPATTAPAQTSTSTPAAVVKRYRVIEFEPNSAALDAKARQRVRELLRSGAGGIKVIGYAPSSARDRLPGERALSVTRWIREIDPAAVVDSGAGAVRNRRCRSVAQNCAVVRIFVKP